MVELLKTEFAQFGGYRFIGKSVSAPPGSGDIFGGLWGSSAPIFEALDAMSEWASDEIYNTAMMSWDGANKLLIYTVGRFMKAGAPIPEGFDGIEVSFSHMAKTWVKGEFVAMISEAPKLCEEAISQREGISFAWSEKFIGAEIYPPENIPQGGVVSIFCYYIPYKLG